MNILRRVIGGTTTNNNNPKQTYGSISQTDHSSSSLSRTGGGEQDPEDAHPLGVNDNNTNLKSLKQRFSWTLPVPLRWLLLLVLTCCCAGVYVFRFKNANDGDSSFANENNYSYSLLSPFEGDSSTRLFAIERQPDASPSKIWGRHLGRPLPTNSWYLVRPCFTVLFYLENHLFI